MDFQLLRPSEAASLVDVSPGTIIGLIGSGKLGALRQQGEWWIPLQCLILFPGNELRVDAACALAELVKTEGPFLRSVADDPETAQRIEGADYPPGSVGTCLKQALCLVRRAQASVTPASPRP
ncbi:MAG: helix-turn-helix domain-containing protein [Arenimonas sp.]|jgi:hypothetical protein